MKTKITLRTTPQLVAEYRHLLTTEWDSSLLEKSRALLRHFLFENGIVFASAETEKPKPKPPQQPLPIPAQASENLREFLEFFNAGQAPAVPDELPTRKSPEKIRLQTQTGEIAVYLMLQSFFQLQGRTAFLRDCQALLFHAVVHQFIPTLRQSRSAEELAYLVNALVAHIAQVWSDVPSQQAFLQATLWGEVGQPGMRAEWLARSLRSTAVDDHEYPTRVTALALELTELERFDEAELVVGQALRTAPEAHMREMLELLRLIYESRRSGR